MPTDPTWIFVIMFSLAFLAGFIDAVVGGGGLIQLPGLLINLPKAPLPALLGTSKIAALSGTSLAAYQYSKKVKFDLKLLVYCALASGIASYAGARLVSLLNPNLLKPLILVILIAIAIYTFIKKDLGSIKTKTLSKTKQYIYGVIIGLVIGFYDGFFGPGTGSFLVLGFVLVLGLEFVQASAYAKVINSMTNITALIVFVKAGNYILDLAIVMAVANVIGNYIGSKMAIKKGNGFVRIVFLVIVIAMIFRYGWDVYFNWKTI